MSDKNIYAALADIMSEVDAITKSKKNAQQGFMYRGIDDVMNDLQPKFAKHRVFIASEVLDIIREERTGKSGGTLMYTILKVRFTFYATDGSSVSSIMVGEAMDSGDKGSNKAMSIALKYCLFQLFLIPTEEQKKEDNDGYINEPAPKLLTFEQKVAARKTQKDLVALYNANKKDVDIDQKKQQLIAGRRNEINSKQPA